MKARPDQIPAGAKWCPRCTRVKPHAAYWANATRPDGLQDYCKQCHRLATDWRKQWQAERRRMEDPEYRRRELERHRRRNGTPAAREARRRYARTPVGRLVHNLATARYNAAHARSEASRRHQLERVGLLTREIERLRAAGEGRGA